MQAVTVTDKGDCLPDPDTNSPWTKVGSRDNAKQFHNKEET